VLREAEFFGIKFPLCDLSPSLTYINDEWLTRHKTDEEYRQISKLADSMLVEVLNDFKMCAMLCKVIQSHIYLRDVKEEDIGEFAQNLAKSARRQHETQDIKTAVLSEVNKAYKEWPNSILNDEYFHCLDEEKNRDVLIEYCARQNLTVDILPKNIKINWKGTVSQFTTGFYFVHRKPKGKSKVKTAIYRL